jgi:hypothetical protein
MRNGFLFCVLSKGPALAVDGKTEIFGIFAKTKSFGQFPKKSFFPNPVLYPLVAKGFQGYLAEALGVSPVRVSIAPKFVMDQLMLDDPHEYLVCAAAVAPADLDGPLPVQSADQRRRKANFRFS